MDYYQPKKVKAIDSMVSCKLCYKCFKCLKHAPHPCVRQALNVSFFFFSSRHRLRKLLLPVNSKMSRKRQVFANYHIIFYIITNIGKNITFYYINTNEIPGELSHENFRYLHMWKYHRCHGFIINRAFHTKKLLKSNGFVFHWCLCNK